MGPDKSTIPGSISTLFIECLIALPTKQEILVGPDKFSIPEVLFNPLVVEGYAPGGHWGDICLCTFT